MILALLSMTATEAATDPKAVGIGDVKVTHSNGSVSVTFTISAGRKATGSDYNLVVRPVLQNGDNRLQLSPVVIFGKKAQATRERHSLNGGGAYDGTGQSYSGMSNGQSLRYGATFPYEQWMPGSRLVFEGVSVGCCSSREVLIGTMADNLLAAPAEEEPQYAQAPPAPPVPRYPSFVRPVSQYQDGLFDRTGAISVHFRQGRTDIDPGLFNNGWTLSQILASIREIQSSGVHRVARIVVAGFASPEGTAAINHRLGRDRGRVIKDYIVGNTGMDPNLVGTYNGEVDWSGLREMVRNSNMQDRYRVLDIIDNTPAWGTGRLEALKRLSGGVPYSYMYRNYFPLLRQAAYIKVYYDDK